jgi:hypothetical protein
MKQFQRIKHYLFTALLLGLVSGMAHAQLFSSNSKNAFFNTAGCLECDNYNVRERFILNGNTYTVVDRAMLDSMVTNGGDFTRVCVSK